MKYLNVAEKHDAAKTISELLSNGSARRREGYSVYNKVFDFTAIVRGKMCEMVMTSVSGHLLQLEFLFSYRNWKNIDPKVLFDAPIRKTCNENVLPIKRTLEREIKSCNGLIIWTDCDREGENIGFEIIQVCRNVKPNITVFRAIFSEITAISIRRALEDLQVPDKNLSDAVDVRLELDLRTGAAFTRFQTMRYQRLFPGKIADKLISYGSCQIPTLGFVAERYKQIEAFVSEQFWKIKVTHTVDDLTVDFNWTRNRLFDKDACEDYLLLCLSDPKAKVESIIVKPKNKWRPIPMNTVELEKLSSRKLKLSAKETMQIAEKLYTKGIISYPRTDTNTFSTEIDLKSLVDQQRAHSIWGPFAQLVLDWGPNPRNGNKSDKAHPPIHPTKLVTNLHGNEAAIYEMICRHFLACVSKDAVGSETTVYINIAGEKFTATGLCIYQRNYLDVYIYEKWNAKEIHNYEKDQIFEPTNILMEEGATSAPPLLTEADLIALMEKHEIGTDATHAEHINTIKERGYIGIVDKGGLVPGVIGMGLYEGYNATEVILTKPILRAQFETDLKKICQAKKDPKSVLQEQIVRYKEAYKQISENIFAMDEKFSLRINETPTVIESVGANVDNLNHMQGLFKCPKCVGAWLFLKQKSNQTGFFIGCFHFPECNYAIWLPEEFQDPTIIHETCGRCGNEVKLLKFKFLTGLYKSMFNAFGSYKTCLRCDSQLRNTFNISLVSGAIDREITHKPKQNATNEHMSIASNKKMAPSKTKDSKIHNFYKSATLSPADRTSEVSVISNNIVNCSATTETTALQQNHNITDVFSDDDIIVYENFNWSTVIQQMKNSNPSLANKSRTDNISSNENYVWGTRSWNARCMNHPKCSGCHETAKLKVKKDALNKDRGFFTCSKLVPCDFFQWADEQSLPAVCETSAQTMEIFLPNSMKCLCRIFAKSLTVHKEGPNKGRQFYGCGNRKNSCGFFKWADENGDSNAIARQGHRTGTTGSGSSHSICLAVDSERYSGNKRRKCGLCRQMGHTKQKCPRKREFPV